MKLQKKNIEIVLTSDSTCGDLPYHKKYHPIEGMKIIGNIFEHFSHKYNI